MLVSSQSDSLEGSVRRTRLSDEIVRRLEEAIRTGAYKTGERLPPERELMRMFGVGRPAVREALFTLRRMGLVEIRSGTPPVVTEPSASAIIGELSSAVQHMLEMESNVRHFQHLRLLFEVALVRDAAANATPLELRRLEKALENNRRAIGNRDRFVETDVEFHYVFAERTRNPIIANMHEAMSKWLHEQRVVALEVPDIEPVSYQEHRAIYEAVARRDPDLSEKIMRDHLAHVSKNYWKSRKNRPRR